MGRNRDQPADKFLCLLARDLNRHILDQPAFSGLDSWNGSDPLGNSLRRSLKPDSKVFKG